MIRWRRPLRSDRSSPSSDHAGGDGRRLGSLLSRPRIRNRGNRRSAQNSSARPMTVRRRRSPIQDVNGTGPGDWATTLIPRCVRGPKDVRTRTTPLGGLPVSSVTSPRTFRGLLGFGRSPVARSLGVALTVPRAAPDGLRGIPGGRLCSVSRLPLGAHGSQPSFTGGTFNWLDLFGLASRTTRSGRRAGPWQAREARSDTSRAWAAVDGPLVEGGDMVCVSPGRRHLGLRKQLSAPPGSRAAEITVPSRARVRHGPRRR